jgi:hypothetical protein
LLAFCEKRKRKLNRGGGKGRGRGGGEGKSGMNRGGKRRWGENEKEVNEK